MKFYKIPGYPNYRLDENGQPWSNRRKRDVWKKMIYKSHPPRGRYPEVGLISLDGKRRTWRIHCLVAKVFLGARPLNCDISHLDGKNSNFHPSNLQWSSRSENMGIDGIIIGEIRNDNVSGFRGIFYDKSRKSWIAYLSINKTRISHRVKTKKDAILYRKQLEKEYLFKQDDIV